jgi:hypothetical protein
VCACSVSNCVVFCLSSSCVLCTQYMLPVSVDCPFCFTLLSHSIYYHQMFGFQMFMAKIKRLIQVKIWLILMQQWTIKISSPLFLFLAWRPSWLEVGITGHNFGRGHPRIIPQKFGCNWSGGFWGEDFYVSWVVIFQNCVRHFRTQTKMAATAELNLT